METNDKKTNLVLSVDISLGKDFKESVVNCMDFMEVIKKEYSCNCTLILKHFKNNQVFLENENSEIQGISQALQSTVYDTLQAFDKK